MSAYSNKPGKSTPTHHYCDCHCIPDELPPRVWRAPQVIDTDRMLGGCNQVEIIGVEGAPVTVNQNRTNYHFAFILVEEAQL